MDPVSLDQLRVFILVVDEGSFSAAARALHRPQSAISYAVRKLEETYSLELFDRDAYRPTLTREGALLLPQARRVLKDAERLRSMARTLRQGVEAEVKVVVDGLYPTPVLLGLARDFRDMWPGVNLHFFSENLGFAVRMVKEQQVDFGVVSEPFGQSAGLDCHPVTHVQLLPVVAPGHHLATLRGPIAGGVMDEYPQLVLTDRSELTQGTDYGVVSHDTWRVSDLGMKRSMLLAGLGWGTLPEFMVKADLEAGTLVRINPAGIGEAKSLRMLLARRTEHGFGPAAGWLYEAIARVGDHDIQAPACT